LRPIFGNQLQQIQRFDYVIISLFHGIFHTYCA
jgi:hypothetical protein